MPLMEFMRRSLENWLFNAPHARIPASTYGYLPPNWELAPEDKQ